MHLRLGIILIPFLLSFTAAGTEFQQLIKETEHVQSVAELKQAINRVFKTHESFLVETLMDRSIDFGYEQLIYEVIYQTDTYRYEYIRMYMVHRQNKIIMGLMRKNDNQMLLKNYHLFKVDSAAIDGYLKQHKGLYGKQLAPNDFIKQFSNIVNFGVVCGEEEKYTRIATQIIYLAKQKSYDKIAYWLASLNPELQAYGVYGIELLKKEGIYPKAREQQILRHLYQRNTPINSCFNGVSGPGTAFREVIHAYQ